MKSSKVEVGQIWQDWDIRRRVGRWIRFVEILYIHYDQNYAQVQNTKTSKITLIRLDRFKPNSTGYRLCQNKERENL